MKKLMYVIMVLFSIALSSCNSNEEDNRTGFNVDHAGRLVDGSRIKKVDLYCVEKNAVNNNSDPWFVYYPKTKTLNDYSDFRLLAIFDIISEYVKDTPEYLEIERRTIEYFKQKSAFIYEEYKNEEKGPFEWPEFLTAYVNNGVSITCDKVLFGKQPGENLCSYFNIQAKPECIVQGIESPKIIYNFGSELPKRMSDYLQNEVWLSEEYWLLLEAEPEEKYDEIKFHITFPVTMEHSKEYITSLYKGTSDELRISKKEFTAECTIKFNWN